MANLNDLIQTYLNAPYELLVHVGREAVVKIHPDALMRDKANNGYLYMTSIILGAIGVDGKLSSAETRYIMDIFGWTEAQVKEYITAYSSRMENFIDVLCRTTPAEIGDQIVALVLCILCVDKKITPEENAFIKKLLS